MFYTVLRAASLVIILCVSIGISTASDLPGPINGITFEEWAAGNARLANNQKLAGILKTLEVDEAQWNEANQGFVSALKSNNPTSPMFTRYAEIFANPSVGRFKGAKDQPEIEARLETFDDYARLMAHLSVGSEAGEDPQKILQEYGLTTYQFSQESANWMKYMQTEAEKGKMAPLADIQQKYEAEFRALYKLPPRK